MEGNNLGLTKSRGIHYVQPQTVIARTEVIILMMQDVLIFLYNA